MRNTFLQTLVSCAEREQRICLVVGDLGYSVVEPFRDQFGPRFINAGVAEQNMTGVAAGMAMAGHKVFTYSIANFSTLRCLEQIRNDVCYHKADVTIVTVGGGLAYGALGYSHHAVQDLACLRGFPGLLLCTPGDPHEVTAVTRFLCERKGPAYLRLGKGGEPTVHDRIPTLKNEGALEVLAGERKAIFACGATLPLAVSVGRQIGAAVFSFPMWSESHSCRAQICQLVQRFERIAVVEEHRLAGGFGSYIRECLQGTGHLQPRIFCIELALDDEVLVGSAAFLRQQIGLTEENVRRHLEAD